MGRARPSGPLADGPEITNNVWVVGGDHECYLVDAAHDGRAVVLSIPRQRKVIGVLCTSADDDHIGAAGELCSMTRAAAYLHRGDRALWDQVHPVAPDGQLEDGDVFTVGDVELHVLHTPGHSRGSVCVYAPALGALFSGDTLGGQGTPPHREATMLAESVRTRLAVLPLDTVVLPAHGEPTTIGDVTA